MSECFELSVLGQLFRVQTAEAEPPQALLVAIHGYTGDEYSMDIFTHKLRKHFCVVYPRAPYPAPTGGFSWVSNPAGVNQPAAELILQAQRLNLCLERLNVDIGTSNLPVFSIGFSQGAALALVYSSMFSKPGEKHALLAGFLPNGLLSTKNGLRQREYFIAHGNRDTTVPTEKSHQMIEFLQASGASTQFCESNTAHKIGVECLKKVDDFFCFGLLPPLRKRENP